MNKSTITLDATTVNATTNYRRSERYSHVQTSDITSQLLADGWQFKSGSQKVVRSSAPESEAKRAHALHTLWFTHPTLPRTLDSIPHMLVTNSHDGNSQLILEMGLYRLICSNGMVIRSATLPTVKLRHVGLTVDLIRNAVTGILERAPTFVRSIEQWKNRILTPAEQGQLAMDSAKVRWGLESSGIRPCDLIRARRYADGGDNLWNVFNRIQEAVVRGGIPVTRFALNGEIESRRRAPALRGLGQTLEINRELWQIAEAYAQ